MNKMGDLPRGKRRGTWFVAEVPTAVSEAARQGGGTDASSVGKLASRLVNDPRMKLAWRKIRTQGKAFRMGQSDETALWIEIRSAYIAARRQKPGEPVSNKKAFKKIALLARRLSGAIVMAGLDVSPYRFYTANEAKLTYAAIAGLKRSRSPSDQDLSDVNAPWLANQAKVPVEAAFLELVTGRKPQLAELLKRVESVAGEAATGTGNTSSVIKRRGRVQRPAVTYFVRRLAMFMEAMFNRPMVGVVATIAAVALEEDIVPGDVKNATLPHRRLQKNEGTKPSKK